jgi:hypothetical protein
MLIGANGCSQDIWCLASSPIATAALGLLGPTAAVWFWQVWRAKAYTSTEGAQTAISKARRYASRARRWLVPVLLLWTVTLVLYSGSYVSADGKGCDAAFTPSANRWLEWFGYSLIPLVVAFVGLAYQHIQFRRYDEEARQTQRSPR